MTKNSPDDLLNLDAVAEAVGWTPGTARTMHKRAKQRRRDGEARPVDLPAPDVVLGQTPAWKRSTIAAFKAVRDGAR